MENKENGRVEELLKNLGKRLDQVIVEIKNIGEDPNYKGRVAELKRSGQKLKEEFDEFKTRHHQLFDEVEDTVERAGNKIKDVFVNTFASENKNKQG